MPRFLGQLGMGIEAKNSEPVIHADHHNTLARQLLTVLPRLRGSSCLKTAAVNPDHYRKLVVPGFRGRPDIQIQAVLAHARVLEHHVPENIVLHAACAEMVRLLHAGPGRNRLRRLPTQIAHRRRGIGNAQVSADAFRSCGSLRYAACDMNLTGRCGRENGGQKRDESCPGESNGVSVPLHLHIIWQFAMPVWNQSQSSESADRRSNRTAAGPTSATNWPECR